MIRGQNMITQNVRVPQNYIQTTLYDNIKPNSHNNEEFLQQPISSYSNNTTFHQGQGKNIVTLQSILTMSMTDTRQQNQKAPTHFTRSRRGNVEVKSDKSLFIVRDKNYYLQFQNKLDLSEETHQKVFDKMKEFAHKEIDIPTALRQFVTMDQHQKPEEGVAPQADVVMADQGTKKVQAIVGVTEELSTMEISNNTNEQSMKIIGKPETITELTKQNEEKLQLMIKMDYNEYANSKLEIPSHMFRYKHIEFKGTNKVVPDYYIKYVEPTNCEVQNTVEKCWSFQEKLYECTEQKIKELREADIEISPNDFEWVIDHFEKSAINDKRQGVKDLIKSFRRKGPIEDLEIQIRVTDQIMEKIYNIWKNQRENRKNRSFIRYFWHYQDSVGDDNYQTFQINQMKNKTSLRGSIKQKMNGYAGAFIERENAVILSDMISHIHQKTLLQLDVYNIDDVEFDKIIGKSGSAENDDSTSTLASVQLMNENEIALEDPYKLPFLPKSEEKEYQEYDQQSSLITQSLYMSKNDLYQQRLLRMIVPAHRDINDGLFIYPQFPIPEQPTKLKGNKLGNKQSQINQRGHSSMNMYEHEIAELDPVAYQAARTAQQKEVLKSMEIQENLTKKKQQKNDEISAQGKGDHISGNVSARDGQDETFEKDSANEDNEKTEKMIETQKRKNKKLKNLNETVSNEGHSAHPEEADKEEEKQDLKKERQKKGPGRKHQDKNQPKNAPAEIQPKPKENELQPEQSVAVLNDKAIEGHIGDQVSTAQQNQQNNKIEQQTTNQIDHIHSIQTIKKAKKQKKNQIVGFNQIKLYSMIIANMKKDLNMKLTGDEIIEKNVCLNQQRAAPGEMERLRALGPVDMSDPQNPQQRTIKLQKKVRKIVQDVKINNETSELMFDFVKQKEQPCDEFENKMNMTNPQYNNSMPQQLKEDNKIQQIPLITQNLQLKQKTLKQEKILAQLNKEYEQIKNRSFQVRRGRNNRIFYKSMAKTVFDYDSDDYLFEANTKKSMEKEKYNIKKEQKNIDRIMINQKNLIEDIHRHCKNKRLKKNIFKMSGIRLMSNGQKVQIEQPNYTNASSDFEKMPRTINDPVIENQFKMNHLMQYKELMANQANEALIKKGVIPENMYENDLSMNQKLEDFDDFLHSRNTSVCTPTNSEMKPIAQQFNYKKQKHENGFNGVFDAGFNPNANTNSFSAAITGGGTLSGSPSGTLGAEIINDQSHNNQLSLIERSQILQNLHFQKTFNKSVTEFKDQMSSDFKSFKQHVKDQQQYQYNDILKRQQQQQQQDQQMFIGADGQQVPQVNIAQFAFNQAIMGSDFNPNVFNQQNQQAAAYMNSAGGNLYQNKEIAIYDNLRN